MLGRRRAPAVGCHSAARPEYLQAAAGHPSQPLAAACEHHHPSSAQRADEHAQSGYVLARELARGHLCELQPPCQCHNTGRMAVQGDPLGWLGLVHRSRDSKCGSRCVNRFCLGYRRWDLSPLPIQIRFGQKQPRPLHAPRLAGSPRGPQLDCR